jgi:two-component system response regulator RegA
VTLSASPPAGQGRSILLVDDDEPFRERLARALRLRGFAVTAAGDLPAAVAAAEQKQPHFAVVDMRMPDATGHDVIEAIVAICPETKIVVLTGYGSIASAVEALHRGAHHYLGKPIDADQLTAALLGLEGQATATATAATVAPSVETPSLARAEWEHIQRVLGDVDGNVSEAARRLGIARRTLQLKLKKYPPRT